MQTMSPFRSLMVSLVIVLISVNSALAWGPIVCVGYFTKEGRQKIRTEKAQQMRQIQFTELAIIRDAVSKREQYLTSSRKQISEADWDTQFQDIIHPALIAAYRIYDIQIDRNDSEFLQILLQTLQPLLAGVNNSVLELITYHDAAYFDANFQENILQAARAGRSVATWGKYRELQHVSYHHPF